MSLNVSLSLNDISVNGVKFDMNKFNELGGEVNGLRSKVNLYQKIAEQYAYKDESKAQQYRDQASIFQEKADAAYEKYVEYLTPYNKQREKNREIIDKSNEGIQLLMRASRNANEEMISKRVAKNYEAKGADSREVSGWYARANSYEKRNDRLLKENQNKEYTDIIGNYINNIDSIGVTDTPVNIKNSSRNFLMQAIDQIMSFYSGN